MAYEPPIYVLLAIEIYPHIDSFQFRAGFAYPQTVEYTMMEPPIIVDNHGDILFFASVEKAEKYLEPIDVENDEYVAYDSVGHLLNLTIQERKWRETNFLRFFKPNEYTVERVIIELAEAEPTHEDQLRERLIYFFALVGEDKDWLLRATLKELVRRGIERHKTE